MEHVMRVLEYSKMKKQLLEHVSCSLGREKVETLVPSTDLEEIQKWQEETAEGVEVLRLKGHIPLGGIKDVKAEVKRAQIGGVLSATELVGISSTLYGGRQMKSFIEEVVEEEKTHIPLLSEYAIQLESLRDLERSINQCIDDYGQVMDSASSELRTLRHQVRSFESNVRSKLESLTKSQSTQKMLSDSIITIRNDRYVIPVKQEYRGSFGGIVHDQSASGATLFIEPQAVVILNNQLREARVKEAQEIERILRMLSDSVAEDGEAILLNLTILAQFDFIFAKANHAKKLKASKPRLNRKGYTHLKDARHPLLDPASVVPISLQLGGDYRSLIITGPNTGGKTVTLKTVGLLTLMAQSGLQVPAEHDSELAVYTSIFADIGDEQSIEQSLSTFSSHMTNIVRILDQMNADSLVLIDELGAGTDPTEGAALAISILDTIYRRGACVMATTHYSELKGYAYNREGAINASVEFDVETLRPTYRLLIGVPGRSNAFAISRRLGLSEEIIEKAKEQIDLDSTQMETVIASLEESQKRVQKESDEATQLRKDSAKLHAELEEKLAELESEKEHILRLAEEKAEKAVKDATEEAEVIIAELRDLQKQGLAVKEHQIIEAKKHLDEAAPKLTSKQKRVKKLAQQANRKPIPGDEVKVLSFGQKGTVLADLGSDEYQVQMGIMKMKVDLKDILITEKAKPVETRPMATLRSTGTHVKPELDLRGERFDEAMHRVEKYIDDALLAGYHQVSIIHGKGTGALRKGVKQLVDKHPRVKTARDADSKDGGLGNTVIELK